MRISKAKLYMRLLFGMLFLLLLASCSSVSWASSLADTSAQETTIIVPLNDWNQLKSNLTKADELIKSSNLSLTEAQALTIKQGEELKTLKIINEERAKELAALKAINKEQASELQQASILLDEQANTLKIASTSLDELKAEIKRNKATEKRLKRQRDTWALLGGVLCIVGAVK